VKEPEFQSTMRENAKSSPRMAIPNGSLSSKSLEWTTNFVSSPDESVVFCSLSKPCVESEMIALSPAKMKSFEVWSLWRGHLELSVPPARDRLNLGIEWTRLHEIRLH